MPPPNTPEEGLVSATLTPRSYIAGEAVAAALDLQALEYEGNVDENLVCPICRVPYVSPVITNCDHVFCHKCIVQSHALNPVCPVDRLPLKLVSETRPAPRIIFNQLDNLLVRCPNSSRGCSMIVSRSLVENHVARYCDKTLVLCPHPSCDKTVVRKDVGKGCLHYGVKCGFCDQVTLKADLEDHQNNECPNRKAICTLCRIEYVRCKQDEHLKGCPEAQASCKFASFGCARHLRRKQLDEHASRCEYRVVGPVGDQLAELRAEIAALQERDRLKERRIKFLENRGFSMPAPTSPEPGADISLPETSSTNEENAPYESRDQYFLSLFETMESKVERLSSALNEVEGRLSMMLFNESSQIKDQLTEIRSTMGVLGMHVRWLMNFRLQERGRIGTNSSNMAAPFPTTQAPHAVQESHHDASIHHRMNESLRENPPRL